MEKIIPDSIDLEFLPICEKCRWIKPTIKDALIFEAFNYPEEHTIVTCEHYDACLRAHGMED